MDKRRAKATEEQKAKERAQRNVYLRKKNAAKGNQQRERKRLKFRLRYQRDKDKGRTQRQARQLAVKK